mmetsp:Transcript_1806/g.4538  ORF Transcript_1806/g.4538 Transcript_1806/m.4538 type:complete len:284 (+) Transcript_1806:75-926(+)
MSRAILRLQIIALVSSLCYVSATEDYDDMGDDMDPGFDEDEGFGGGPGGFGGMDDEYGGGEPGSDGPVPGAIKLDNYTFDKVIGLKGHAVLVKFCESFTDVDKEDEFRELAKASYSSPNFFIGEVQVSEDENEDLRDRFKLSTDDFPAFLLFRGEEDMQRYEGPVTAADISMWLRKKGVKISTSGTIAELDELAQKFLRSGFADNYITEAEALADSTYKADSKASVYVKIMKKIKDKGAGYVEAETARVQKVMSGNLTPEKMRELSEKVQVLSMFQKEASEEL